MRENEGWIKVNESNSTSIQTNDHPNLELYFCVGRISPAAEAAAHNLRLQIITGAENMGRRLPSSPVGGKRHANRWQMAPLERLR